VVVPEPRRVTTVETASSARGAGRASARHDGAPAEELSARRLRSSVRLSRLVTAIDLFSVELEALTERDHPPDPGGGWRVVAEEQLARARTAAHDRRIDDAWDFLHSSRRQALNALSLAEVRNVVVVLQQEAAEKLVGWRRAAAAAVIATARKALAETTTGSDEQLDRPPGAVYSALIKGQQLLDENSHNAYLRLRLVGQRLVLAATLLAATLIGLGAVVAIDALGDQFGSVTVLHEIGTYLTVALLGALGALLSFSLGTLRAGTSRRIYELASARYAATAARLLVGSAAAITVGIALQSGVVTINQGWLLIIVVAAGFSERLVRQIVESLSADAEKPREPTPSSGSTSAPAGTAQ
jgi:hypothetical protein